MNSRLSSAAPPGFGQANSVSQMGRRYFLQGDAQAASAQAAGLAARTWSSHARALHAEPQPQILAGPLSAQHARTCTAGGRTSATQCCRHSSGLAGSQSGSPGTCDGSTHARQAGRQAGRLAGRQQAPALSGKLICSQRPKAPYPLAPLPPPTNPHLSKNSSHHLKGSRSMQPSLPQGEAAGAPNRRPGSAAAASTSGHSSCRQMAGRQ